MLNVITPSGTNMLKGSATYRFRRNWPRASRSCYTWRSMAGAPHPWPPVATPAAGMSDLVRTFDWATTPLGPAACWPAGLRTAVSILLGSRHPMFLWWGPTLVNIYNDAYAPILGSRHPEALGRSAPDVWADVWSIVGPQAELVMREGRSTWNDERLLIMERHGYTEETYFTFSYSPAPDDAGGIGGVFCACSEDTARVLGQRRLATLSELATGVVSAKSPVDACERAAEALRVNPHDVPYALLYLANEARTSVGLCASVGLPREAAAAPPTIALDGSALWPVHAVMAQSVSLRLTELPPALGALPGGPWPEPSSSALLLPIAETGRDRALGVLIAGLSPRRTFDDDYAGFLTLVAGQVAAAVAEASAYETEMARAQALAELDRAKTTFFSNVSHEFRTPLTLLLGPLADLHAVVPAEHHGTLDVVHRNALRLLRLVNTLLDFARLEAGRLDASFQPTDLGQVTTELASAFRAAIEKAGLELRIDCEPHIPPVYVDRDMWEQVVLNLVSNAFKFTMAGHVYVGVGRDGGRARLIVRDTGAGISAADLPLVFDRFHRTRSPNARTHEGTGIGLALVRELVRLHGGTIAVSSVPGQGTEFTVHLRLGHDHLLPELVGGPKAVDDARRLGATPYVEEAARWTRTEPARSTRGQRQSGSIGSAGRPRILVAEDNADMRDYILRLLSDDYQVETTPDGAAALSAARKDRPDLVLADVMMPGLDGVELVTAIRGDPALQALPVILLSARAGDEARIEGVRAGADDYLTKPFSARELVARVRTHVGLGRLRAETEDALRQSETRFRTMADHAPVLIWVRDAEGRCTWFNRPWLEFVGRPLEAEIGQGWADNVHPDDAERCLQVRVDALGERQPFSTEYRLRRHDGVYRWVLDNGVPLVTADGFVGYIGSCTDITALKDLESERESLLALERRARASAEQANRLKDEFLATLSHELRTPLNAMLGWARLLRLGKVPESGLARALEVIERNAHLQTQLVEDLLDVSRIVTGKLRLDVRPVDLPRVIEAAVDSTRPAAEARRVAVAVDVDPDAAVVAGDANRLQQVVWNLLSNAIKFTPAGGRADVVVRRDGDHVEIAVSDTGIGIERDFLPFIFDRFRQADGRTNREHGGLGLGMAIVKHVVEAHGGTVSASSPGSNEGTTFRVRLPSRAVESTDEEDDGRRARVATARSRIGSISPVLLEGVRVLVVDDEADARNLIEYVLVAHHAKVVLADSVAAALACFDAERPDVLLTDIGMPDEDGWALIEAIRTRPAAAGGDVPAVALTAYAWSDDRLRALRAGFQRHLAKPVDPAALVATVAALAGRELDVS